MDVFHGVGLAGQGVVDDPGFFRVAPHHRQIILAHGLALKLAAQGLAGFLVQGKDQYSGSAPVQTMGRIDPAPQLVPEQLDGKAGLPPVQLTAVDQEPGGLVDDDQLIVLIKNGKHGGQCTGSASVAQARGAGAGKGLERGEHPRRTCRDFRRCRCRC